MRKALPIVLAAVALAGCGSQTTTHVAAHTAHVHHAKVSKTCPAGKVHPFNIVSRPCVAIGSVTESQPTSTGLSNQAAATQAANQAKAAKQSHASVGNQVGLNGCPAGYEFATGSHVCVINNDAICQVGEWMSPNGCEHPSGGYVDKPVHGVCAKGQTPSTVVGHKITGCTPDQ